MTSGWPPARNPIGAISRSCCSSPRSVSWIDTAIGHSSRRTPGASSRTRRSSGSLSTATEQPDSAIEYRRVLVAGSNSSVLLSVRSA
jgi:hypothetical protein